MIFFSFGPSFPNIYSTFPLFTAQGMPNIRRILIDDGDHFIRIIHLKQKRNIFFIFSSSTASPTVSTTYSYITCIGDNIKSIFKNVLNDFTFAGNFIKQGAHYQTSLFVGILINNQYIIGVFEFNYTSAVQYSISIIP